MLHKRMKNVKGAGSSMKEKTLLNQYIGKIVLSKTGLKGKCIGFLPESNELIIVHDKGGRVACIPITDVIEPAKEARKAA